MKVYLYLVDKLLNYSLPHDISGSYSFDENPDEEAKLINIEARDNKWFLYSTADVSIMVNNKRVKEQEIVPNNFYFIRRDNINYVIYVCNLIENHFDVYSYDKKINVIIGNADICNLR